MKPKPKLCGPHKVGIHPDDPPFYYEGCVMCEKKKAAGKVTGNEGHLTKGRFAGLAANRRKAPRSEGSASDARRTGAGRPGSGSSG